VLATVSPKRGKNGTLFVSVASSPVSMAGDLDYLVRASGGEQKRA